VLLHPLDPSRGEDIAWELLKTSLIELPTERGSSTVARSRNLRCTVATFEIRTAHSVQLAT
jgi:hypothetical protein